MSIQIKPGIKLSTGIITFFGILVCFLFIPDLALSRFENNGDGTVTDTLNSLMWAQKDNGDLINWQAARSYTQNFNGGGYNDWRLPTLKELESLYDHTTINDHGYHTNSLIDISAGSCWASENRNNEAARFNFIYGEVYWLYKTFSGPGRVLPVRAIKLDK